MTNRRRIFLTTMSLGIGTALSFFIFYLKKGSLDKESLLYLGTVFGYSALIVVGIGWYLQKKGNKDS